MSLLKRAHVRGINYELVRRDLISWPNEKIADEASDAVADNLPEEVLPEQTDEGGLTPEQAALVIQHLADVAQEIAAQSGGVKDAEYTKLAASVDYMDAARAHAWSLVIKTAEELSGTAVVGDGKHQTEIAEGEGQIDAVENPSDEKVGPRGTSKLDTTPGAVGAEKPQDKLPGASDAITNEVSKLSSYARDLLNKLSEDGKKVEPKDNQAAPGAAISRGTTDLPEGGEVGKKKKPTVTPEISPAISNEVAKLSELIAPEVMKALKKLSEEEPKTNEKEAPKDKAEESAEKLEEKAEKLEEKAEKKEEKAEDKTAALRQALATVLKGLSK